MSDSAGFLFPETVCRESIVAYTDGACKGNPGRGGWGVFIESSQEGVSAELFGGADETTNNRMELLAVAKALEHLAGLEGIHAAEVIITMDSQYVHKGITEWSAGWIRKGWIGSTGKPVANKDLWLELLALRRQVGHARFEWVRGHSGHPGNEKADALANKGVPA